MRGKSNEHVTHSSSAATPTHHNSTRCYSTKTFRLLTMLSLTFSFFFIELIVGNITNSLALVADAFHMLSDVVSLFIGLFAVRIAKRRSDINTYGWVRAEVVGANINTVFLLALCLTIIFDAIKRYIQPEPIENPTLLLIVGSVGLGINIIGLFLFQGFHGHSHGGGSDVHEAHGHSHHTPHKSKLRKQSNRTSETNTNTHMSKSDDNFEPVEAVVTSSDFRRHSLRALDEVIVDCISHPPSPSSTQTHSPTQPNKKAKKSSMNMHGVFLHVLADALGSVAVIISSLIIKFVPHNPGDTKHWTVYVDPTLSVIIVIIITVSAIPLLKETTHVLLQTVPKELQVSTLKKQLLENVSEVDGIHDLHVWRLTSNAIVATAHLHRRSFSDYMTVADKVKRFFHDAGIHSTTIQYEYWNDEEHDRLMKKNENGEEMKASCLLSCPDEVCETKTCCTKDSIRSNAVYSVVNMNQTRVDANSPSATYIRMENEPLCCEQEEKDRLMEAET
ncbi:unnamed protein product, partial [Adineta ricciae]